MRKTKCQLCERYTFFPHLVARRVRMCSNCFSRLQTQWRASGIGGWAEWLYSPAAGCDDLDYHQRMRAGVRARATEAGFVPSSPDIPSPSSSGRQYPDEERDFMVATSAERAEAGK